MPERSRQTAPPHELRSASRLVFMRGIHEYSAGNFVWIKPCINTRVQTAERVADENVGAGNTRPLEQRVQLLGHFRGSSWVRPRVAPAHACSVKPACAGASGNRSLNLRPAIARSAGSCIENNRGAPLARTVDIQPVSPDINQLSDYRQALAIQPHSP